MAATTVTLTASAFPQGVDQTARSMIIRGTAALGTGGTYVTNGLPITWKLPENITPNNAFLAYFQSPSNGFVYYYDPTNVTLRIFVTGTSANAALNEVANLTAITATTLTFEAWFQRV